MQVLTILDIKPFMQFLFQPGNWDTYEFVSAELKTDMLYQLDGHINSSFFSKDELEALSLTNHGYLTWQYAREKIFQIIKGKKTPSTMKLVLRVDTPSMEGFFSPDSLSQNSNHIESIFLNIHYQENKLNVICGFSYKIFTLDKEKENDFFHELITLFKSKSIACEY